MKTPHNLIRVIEIHDFEHTVEWVRICPMCFPNFEKDLPDNLGFSIQSFSKYGKCSHCKQKLMKGYKYGR